MYVVSYFSGHGFSISSGRDFLLALYWCVQVMNEDL